MKFATKICSFKTITNNNIIEQNHIHLVNRIASQVIFTFNKIFVNRMIWHQISPFTANLLTNTSSIG